jgi:chromosome segregation ATPase
VAASANGGVSTSSSSHNLQHEAEVAALRAQVESIARDLQTAQAAARNLEGEAAGLRQQLAAAQEAAQVAAARQGTAQLEQQLRESSDMLYAKQVGA